MSDSDSWCSPPKITVPLADYFGGPVGCDPCSNGRSIVQAVHVYTFGGLHRPWGGPQLGTDTAYENFPYSNGGVWTDKCCVELKAGRVREHVRLSQASTSSLWFRKQCLEPKRNPRLIFLKRVAFLDPFPPKPGKERTGARFDAVLTYYGPHPLKFQRYFKHLERWSTWGR